MAQTAEPVNSFDKGPFLAFFAIVLLGGLSSVAVRFGNFSLPPIWSAAARYLLAAPLFWAILWWRRTSLPRGRTLAGAIIYGVLAIGFNNALLYWGLAYVTASLTTVLLSLIPLVTLMVVILHRQEEFAWRSPIGGLVALGGTLLAIGGQPYGDRAPLLPLLALTAAVLVFSDATVIYKSFPHTDPVTANAISLSVGGPILLVISRLLGEPWILPAGTATWLSLAYLVLFGTLLLLYLLLYLLDTWAASATMYVFLLIPISATLLGNWLLQEPLTPGFVVGALLAMAGVYFGALARQ